MKRCVLQLPDWQVPRLLLQALPSVAFGVEHAPVKLLHVPATWQAAGCGHVTGLLPMQVPLWQLSVCVHALPSLHAVPFATFAGVEQAPVTVSHVLANLHPIAAAQTTGLLPVHVPPWQVSVCVHALPSLHVVPFAMFAGVEQAPVTVSHVLAILHAVAAAQLTGLLPVHVPLWQVSVCVQALPSLHVVPFAAFVGAGHWPVAGSQVPGTLHVPAVHVVGVPGMQAPAWQLSPTVQALPSLHVDPLVAATQLPVVIEQMLQAPHALPLFCQAPFASHVCGWAPLQAFVPGTQLPVHEPLAVAQTYVHPLPLSCQTPNASHTCGCSMLHRFAVGEQTPVHAPAAIAQTYAHGVPMSCQAPVPSHTWGCNPLQRFVVGVQLPEHAPPPQTYMHAVPVFCHAPFTSHVCGCSKLHCTDVGLHDPLHESPLQTNGQRLPLSCHMPPLEQTCG
jgi:hypothetical protein